jgi:hypothetical protein
MIGNGEHNQGRVAMDRLTKQMIDAGASPEVAKDRARKVAIEVDRKGYGKSDK